MTSQLHRKTPAGIRRTMREIERMFNNWYDKSVRWPDWSRQKQEIRRLLVENGLVRESNWREINRVWETEMRHIDAALCKADCYWMDWDEQWKILTDLVIWYYENR